MSGLARPALVGDGIENPGNANAMQDAAALFGWNIAFRDRKALAAAFRSGEHGSSPSFLDLQDLTSAGGPIVAFDNLPGAQSLYGFRAKEPSRVALVVGNERHGLAHEIRRVATHAVHIPMMSHRVTCLNVAAASAVGLFYLSRGGSGRQPVRSNLERVRPEILLLRPGDHVELGSTLRSAAAFGWRRAFVEDGEGVWFGAGHSRTTEGRAAARRAKNRIRVIPVEGGRRFAFDEAVVVVPGRGARPIARTNLSRGPRQVVIVADGSRVDFATEDWGRFARRVEMSGLDLPALGPDQVARYRLFATIALAEIARQVGTRGPRVRRRPQEPTWDRSLRIVEETGGETYSLAELMRY